MTASQGDGDGGATASGSISRRLLIAAGAWTVLVLLIGGWSLQALYRNETARRLDADIDATIVTLLTAVDTKENGEVIYYDSMLPNDERFRRTFSGWYWAFIFPGADGTPQRADRSRSFFESLPDIPPYLINEATSHPGSVRHANGYGPDASPIRMGVRSVRLPDRKDPVYVFAAIDRSAANEAVSRFAVQLAIALLILAAGLVLGILVLIRYGLRPLHVIQDRLSDVRSGRRQQLDGEYPEELAPLVREINTLISHNRKVVERARTQVGNLAHALKTPLAVLLNESRVGEDRLSDVVRRQSEAMRNNVEHYLRRAQAAAQAEVLTARADVTEAVEGIARMLERLHRDKNITIDVDADEAAIFRGERGDLDDLVGNLLDNAAKWCRARVKVRVARKGDTVEVTVDDDGPGLRVEDRSEALRRGKRLDESEPGTGLGLSIVTELAEIYGGRLHLEDSPLGGLRARLELPAAAL
ncbi:MAG: sensor histidine kinase [Hyphomonadaceae bacterium]